MANYNQISYGSQGSEVTELQKLLNQNGYQLDEDGIYGSKTQAAVKDYQQKNNLDVDGIVGNNTWGALTSATTGTTTNQSTTPASTGFQNPAYQESDAVKQAQAMLQQQMNNKPGEYTSQWQTQLNDMLQQIQNREKFSYDMNGDALYQQYKNQYALQGQQAMMDTMGQAQAMTGGYGNSYAQSVGQQAYQGYIQQLNDKVPELYQLALSKYQMEGDEMKDQAALIAQMEDRDYGRYQDQLNQYYTELEQAYDRYDTERDYDYGMWADGRDFGYGQYIDDRNYQYQQDRDKVADEQWQKEYDEALRQWNFANKQGEYAPKATPAATTTPASNPQPKPQAQPQPEPEPEPTGFTGSTYKEAVNYMENNGVSSADASGVMTQSEWQRRKASLQAYGTGGAEVKNYSSYKEYLADYVEYQTSKK